MEKPSARKRVVVTDHAFKGVEAEERVARDHAASFECFDCTTEAETITAVRDADVAFVNFAPISRSVLTQMRAGSTVIRYGIGFDNVDVEAAREYGIQVANVPDYGVDTVADHAAAGLLALARRIPHYDRGIRANGWVRPAAIGPVRGFRSTTVGLLGFGRIAQAVHARLAPFGFTFIGHDPFAANDLFEQRGVERVSLTELAQRAHALSIHAPSTPETRHVINDAFLAAMPSGAVLVNTARGDLIDEHALARALSEGHVAGAALDVFEQEPLPSDSPLRGAPGVLLSPHAAFYDEDSLVRLQELASEEAGRALRGEPLRCPIA